VNERAFDVDSGVSGHPANQNPTTDNGVQVGRLSIPQSRPRCDSAIGSPVSRLRQPGRPAPSNRDTGIPGSASPGACSGAGSLPLPARQRRPPDRQPGHQPPHSRVVPRAGVGEGLACCDIPGSGRCREGLGDGLVGCTQPPVSRGEKIPYFPIFSPRRPETRDALTTESRFPI
jgi:hypothetical protein